MNLKEIAEEISFLDFSSLDPDNTDEAIFNLATDLYDLSEDKANEVINILMNNYIKNIK